MKQFVILNIFLLIMCTTNVLAADKVLTGDIEYNFKTNNDDTIINHSANSNGASYKPFLVDFNNIQNINYLLNGITNLKDRKLAKFSDGSYGVMYYDNPMYSWYYSNGGQLISCILKDSLNYPTKFIKYDNTGKIINKGYRISKNESYIYAISGKLLAHWVGENCYDETGNVIMRRKIFQ